MNVFSSLIDQSEVVTVLQEAIRSAHNQGDQTQGMTHAWLFTGPPGSGRSNAAIAFAAALVCKDNGCGNCKDCTTTITNSHADVELIKTEGLSIKIDEIRDLISRASWAPSIAAWRVVVIEDADRLTDSAANALLKVIEEPGLRTVWLLCAPTPTDVLSTIRSRCRHLVFRLPSINAVTKLLIERDYISKELAEFAARASQGHIGVAKYLAANQHSRDNRLVTLKLPFMVKDIASAYKAAEILVNSAKAQAELIASNQNEVEMLNLQQAWGKIGSKLATGGAKVIKDLEKEQKTRSTRMVRDYLDIALLNLCSFYRDILLIQSNLIDGLINQDLFTEIIKISNSANQIKTTEKIQAILEARKNLNQNAVPLLTIEALMCRLK